MLMLIQLRSFQDSIYFKHIKNSRLDTCYVHLSLENFWKATRNSSYRGAWLLYFFRLLSTERSFICLPIYVLLYDCIASSSFDIASVPSSQIFISCYFLAVSLSSRPPQRPNKYLFPFERHEDSLSSSFDLPPSDRRPRIPRAAVSSLPRRCERRLAVRELLRKSFNEILESRSPKPFVVVKPGPTESIRLQDEHPGRQEEEGECAREKRAQVWADTSWYVGESLETR